MLAKYHRKLRFRTSLAWLVVWTLLLALFPSLPARTDAATTALFTLSQSTFPVGYAGTTVTVTGGDSFAFKPDTKVSLYNSSGFDMTAVGDVTVVDKTHLTFTLKPGVPEGTYNLYVMSYGAASVPLNIVTSFDPINVRVTPGVDRDIRFDWNDASGSSTQQLIIQYGPINQQTFTGSKTALISDQTSTLTGLQNKTAYRFKISTRRPDGSLTPGVILDNGGQGYLAIDSTPPGDVTDIHVVAVQNGFSVHWTDPTDPDLNLINVQVAEHGTTQWSTGVVVQKGVQQALISPLNTSKRYDLRFTKSDTYGNYAYQIDNHGGYGYTSDTTAPAPVGYVSVDPSSDTSASLSWTDPDDTNNPDFHHVNIYLSSDLTDWKLITHVNKGVQAATLTGLEPNIEYRLRMTTVDDKGNEDLDNGYTTTFTTGDSTDVEGLLGMTVAQEPQGGLHLTWDPNVTTNVDFSKFKLYYAPISSTDPQDYRVTTPSSKSATGAYLRDMPRGLFKLQMRLYDSDGIEQVIGDFTNDDFGYYVSGNGGLNGPNEVGDVRIQSTDSHDMQITWAAATTDGTSIEVFYAPISGSGSFTLSGKVNKNTQSYTVTGLQTDINYEFKLVVVDDTQNTQSGGVVYTNNGFGYNVLGGNNHPPGEVQNATATVSLNTIQVSYTEPTDENFDSVNIYAERQDTLDVVSTTTASKGDGGATIRGLLPNIPYVLHITTVDTYGNESAGILLNNSGAGYVLTASAAQSPNEVQNAMLVPGGTQMTVRFQEPQMTDYNDAVVSIKMPSDSSYSQSQTVSRGQNDETTFYNLQPNQQYQVHISTVSLSGHTSPGIDLGGATGAGLQPIADPSGVLVTPGNHSLTVTWQPPINTAPTSYEVQIQPTNSSTWGDPLFVSPQTLKAVFHGLANDQSYRVRICTVLNSISSSGSQPSDWSGFSPHAASIVTNPGEIEQNGSSQIFSILGTNTQFPWSSTDATLKLYDQNGNNVSSLLSGKSMQGQDRIDVTVSGAISSGTYKLELTDPYDGVLDTTLTVKSGAPIVTLASESELSASYGYSAFAMYLTGTGFTANSTVSIDGIHTETAYDQDSNHLSFTMPSGLLPGAHKIQVTTGTGASNALGFNVYPFLTTGTVSMPATRSGTYMANLTVTNADSYSRNTEILLVIRRNGLYVETKTTTYTFAAGETKNFKISFGGGTTTPYANGPTKNISVEAFVVDGANLAPLADPLLLNQDVNLY